MSGQTDQSPSREAVERLREAVEADEYLDGVRLDHSDALTILALLTPATPQPATGEVKEVLAWYAEQAAGCRKISSDGHDARQALDKDGGERARNALARFERDHLTPATQAARKTT